MRKGPNGERRTGDSVQVAHRVFAIAVGDEKDEMPSGRRNSGLAGAAARAAKLDKKEKSAIARHAASIRWK
jgi:hypothetical protein